MTEHDPVPDELAELYAAERDAPAPAADTIQRIRAAVEAKLAAVGAGGPGSPQEPSGEGGPAAPVASGAPPGAGSGTGSGASPGTDAVAGAASVAGAAATVTAASTTAASGLTGGGGLLLGLVVGIGLGALGAGALGSGGDGRPEPEALLPEALLPEALLPAALAGPTDAPAALAGPTDAPAGPLDAPAAGLLERDASPTAGRTSDLRPPDRAGRVVAAVSAPPRAQGGTGLDAIAPTSAAPAGTEGVDAVERGHLDRERRVIAAARVALGRGDAAEAMAAVARHQQEFPRGSMSEERDALRVQALAASGRLDEAQRAFISFEAAWPSSPLRSGLRRALGDQAAGGLR